MLSSIHPLGERGRGQRWSITVTAYTAASAAAGTAMGLFAGTLGDVVVAGQGPPILAVAAVACVAAAVTDARRAPVPWVRRQVNEDWLHAYRGWVYGAGFGAQLGAAVATTITTATVPLFVTLAALTGSAPLGAGIGAVFGLVRAMPVLLLGRVHRPAQLWRLHADMARLGPASARVAATVVGALAVVLAAVLAAGGTA